MISRTKADNGVSAVGVARVRDAVMQAVFVALPELNAIETHAIAAPVWWSRHIDAGETLGQLAGAALEFGAVGDGFALVARPGIDPAVEGALREVGVATIFTAITLSVGVATWGFSDLKFQADMGILLTFMFMVNMLMAITVLPAFAVKLDSLFPRRGPVKAPAIGH